MAAGSDRGRARGGRGGRAREWGAAFPLWREGGRGGSRRLGRETRFPPASRPAHLRGAAAESRGPAEGRPAGNRGKRRARAGQGGGPGRMRWAGRAVRGGRMARAGGRGR